MISQFSKRCNMNKLWKCIILSLGAIIIGKVEGISAEKAIKRPELFVQQDKNSKTIKLDAAEFRWKKLAPNLFSSVNSISKSYSWEESNKFKIKMQKHFISLVRTFLTNENFETLSIFVKWIDSNFYTNEDAFISLLEQFLTNQSVLNFSNIEVPNLRQEELNRLGENLAILVRDMGELISYQSTDELLEDAFSSSLYDNNIEQHFIEKLLSWKLVDQNGNLPDKEAIFLKDDSLVWSKAVELFNMQLGNKKNNSKCRLWMTDEVMDLVRHIASFVDIVHYKFQHNTCY